MIAKGEIICLLYCNPQVKRQLKPKLALFNSGARENVLQGCKIIIAFHIYFKILNFPCIFS